MKLEDYKAEILLIAAGTVAVALIAGVYVRQESLQGQIEFELAKALANLVILAVIGVWVRQLFDESASHRQKQQERRKHLQEVLEKLKNGCGEALRTLQDEKLSDIGDFYVLFKGPGLEKYDELLDIWQSLEPSGPALAAQAAYKRLYELYRKAGLNTDFRKKAISEIDIWHKYFQKRYWHAEAQIPQSWK